ncbi:hypothetical protein GF369_01155, partial [Candidatus Peregrinibacteria bacterium]|nr:hypothetical protein [Candidatus Peregrinibacteria bacterium]
MPFEQAKRQFETKTNQSPEKVEGNWKDFTGKAKSYLANKQKQVSGFIDSLDYPNKKQDKQNYLSEMGKAIDDVIDEKEATKKEMAKYKGLLYKKSNQLKQTLLHERKLMEIRQTKEKLKPTVKAFRMMGLSLKTKDSVTVYLRQNKEKRIPLEKINKAMKTITQAAREGLPRKEINRNKNLFYEIFNHYCWGDTEQATKKTTLLKEQITFFKQCK